MASQSGGGAAKAPRRKSASSPSTASSAPRSKASTSARPLSPSQFKIVHDALVQYEVIVLRDQDITVDQQMAFGALFGELSIHPFSPNLADKPEVIILDYSDENPPALTDIWHVDETFRETPPLATILRAKVVPEVGGDTLFASMSAAYRGLSERMKQHIHGMEALHDFKPWRPLFAHSDRAKLRKLEDDFPNPWHPVVRVHPVSGRRVLYVNQQFCVRIKGPQDRRERHAAALPLSPGDHSRIPAQGEVAAQHAGDVGQPLGPALCRPRLLSGAPHHGARDGEGRQADGRHRRLHARHACRQRHDQTRHRRGHAARPQARFRSLLRWPSRDAARLLGLAALLAPGAGRPRPRGPASPSRSSCPIRPAALTDVLGRADRRAAAIRRSGSRRDRQQSRARPPSSAPPMSPSSRPTATRCCSPPSPPSASHRRSTPSR